MGFRDTFLRPFKKLKRRLARVSHKPGRGDACIPGEGAELAGAVLQPVPRVVAEGMDGREEDRASIEGSCRGLDPGAGAIVETGPGPSQEGDSANGGRISLVDPPQPVPSDSDGRNADGL